MKLHVIGSGSSGNGYILEGVTSALIIEAGVSILEAKKALDFDLRKIAGLIASHSHGDHMGKIHEYLNVMIPCWISEDMLHNLAESNTRFLPYLYENNASFTVGEFLIKPFEVIHDVPCSGFLIHHAECGKVCFITDSHYSPFRFSGVSQWLLEVNFDQEILDRNVLSGSLLPVVRNRIMNSHMSLQTAMELLKANDLSKTRNVVLLHLSNGNSDERKFKSEIEGLTGVPVYVADKGMCIDFNEKPF